MDKVSASFPAEVGDGIRASAERSGLSVSAWLTEAARARLRAEALAQVLDEYQVEAGAFTDAEIAEAEAALGLRVSEDTAA